MTRPRLLDLFCGAGGCSVGYHRAGFDVVGVDNRPMPRYPFEFLQADALEYLDEHGHRFDAIHASPPCQAFSVTRHLPNVGKHVDLLGPSRELLLKCGRPWVIENVIGAPMHYSIMLCGTMFPELRVQRHRLFETSFWMWQPEHPIHKVKLKTHRWCAGQREQEWQTVAGHAFGVKAAKLAMGIDWMTRDELAQAIPPDYTNFIGKQLIERLK